MWPEDNGTETLRPLHAELDDEERFQADLKKAVRQSLGKCYTFFFFLKFLFLSLCMLHIWIARIRLGPLNIFYSSNFGHYILVKTFYCMFYGFCNLMLSMGCLVKKIDSWIMEA